MARTTEALVGGIVDLDADIPVQPFIDTANGLVTEICEPVTTYDSTRLEQIETWLAAHFYAQRDPAASPTSEGAGPVQVAYQSAIDLFLANTRYGQHAMLLDTNGGLARLSASMAKGGRKIPRVSWLGKTVEEREGAEEDF